MKPPERAVATIRARIRCDLRVPGEGGRRLGLWLFRCDLSATGPTGFEWKEAEAMGGNTG